MEATLIIIILVAAYFAGVLTDRQIFLDAIDSAWKRVVAAKDWLIGLF